MGPKANCGIIFKSTVDAYARVQPAQVHLLNPYLSRKNLAGRGQLYSNHPSPSKATIAKVCRRAGAR